jgi:Tol biopolymer transport system component
MNADGTGLTDLGPGGDPAWAPDGSRIAFRADSGIWLMNPDGSGRTELVHFGASPTWSPDSTRVAFTRWEEFQGTKLFAIDVDGSDETFLAYGAPLPDWSPDGSRIVFGQYSGVWVVTVGGAGSAYLGSGGAPNWSPDGGSIAFSTSRVPDHPPASCRV